MRYVFVAMLLLFAFSAQAKPPSDASIQELLQFKEAEWAFLDTMMIDATMAQLEPALAQIMQYSLQEGQTATDKDLAVAADMRNQIKALLQERINWNKLKPQMTQLYRQAFSQPEIDGILAFYRSDIGHSLMAKEVAVEKFGIKEVMLSVTEASSHAAQVIEDVKLAIKANHQQ